MRCLSHRVSLVCAGLLCFGAASSAQTAEEVVAKNLEAKGGVQLLRDTQTVRVAGTITGPGGKRSTVSMSKRPNLFRHEMAVADNRIVQGFDGTTPWVANRGMAPQVVPAGPQADAIKQRGEEFDSPFIDWQQKGHTIEYKGRVTEAGKDYHRLVFVRKGGLPSDYYIDPTTWLEAKIVVEDPVSNGKMETRFTDYRNVDGRMVPFVVTNLLNGAEVAQIRFERIEFNVPLDDALFRIPK
jgi:outer membrane lipoprotein-sorting protein